MFVWEKELVQTLLESLHEVCLASQVRDFNWWKYNSNGSFTMRSFAKAWWNIDVEKSSLRLVWRGLALPRAKLLVWFILQNKINIIDRLRRILRLNVCEATCAFCNKEVDSVEHRSSIATRKKNIFEDGFQKRL